MKTLSLTGGRAAASPPASRWDADRQETEMSANERVIAQISNRLLVPTVDIVIISRISSVSAGVLCCRTQQMKV